MWRHPTPEDWDHTRDERKHYDRPGDRFDQRTAVAKLVEICEGLVASGQLGAELELKVRRDIAEALVAFNMPSKVESDTANR
jgi:hypothetical protein